MFRRNLLRDRSGASAIEFAMIAPLLIFMLVGIFELGTLALISSGLDNAVNNISREIRTGQTPGPTSAASFENMVCTNMGGNVADCMTRMTVSVSKFGNFTSTNANGFATAPPDSSFDKGGAGDIIVVKVDYNWPIVSPMLAPAFPSPAPFQLTVSSRAAFKNEPFS